VTPTPEIKTPGARPPLARDFTRFLLELSIGVHRYAMYPLTHPSLGPTAEAVTDHLLALLRERAVLRVGVGRRELLVEGGTSDPRHPVLGDLARRLHHQQIGALSFAHGVRLHEVQELLEVLGRSPSDDEVPIGLRAVDELPSWPHARIHALGVDRLTLGESTAWSGARALDLWMGLAAAVLGQEAVDAERASDPVVLARALDERVGEAGVEAVVSDQLAQLMAELRATAGVEGEDVRSKVAVLLRGLEEGTLDRIVAMGGDPVRRRTFVHDANHGLPVEAVFRVVESAARAGGQTISTSMSRLLGKLSAHPAEDAGGGSDTPVAGWADRAGVTEIVERLLDDWDLGDPNPERYTAVLDTMARSAPVFVHREQDGQDGGAPAGALRVVLTALEVGVFGLTVGRALLDLVDAGRATHLVDLLGEAGEDNVAARAMLDELTSPRLLGHLLSRREVEEEALRAVVERAGEAAIDPLMEVLVESESRALRRKVFDALAGLGPRVGQRAAERLEDPRWFVQRNMLALLHQLDGLPDGFDPLWLTSHGDHRVRREAFPLALRDASCREQALSLALSDRDERLVRMALLELRDGVPDTLVPAVVKRALHEDRSDEIRALAVRTVRDATAPVVKDTLLALAAPARSLFGRPRLGGASAAVLAALEVLRERWGDDRQVRPVLEQARRNRNPALRRAAGGTP
jgi:hypothetical protein